MDETTLNSTNNEASAAAEAATPPPGNSILTGNTGNVEPPAGDEANQSDSAEAAKPENEALPASPEDYKIEFAPDTMVDETLLGRFQSWAHENKISLESATQLAKDYETMIKQQNMSLPERQAAAIQEQGQAWMRELQDDKELGGPNWGKTKHNIDAAMKQYGTDELRQMLDSTGLGNHPALVKTMAQIGKDLAEPTFVRGEPGGRKEYTNYELMREAGWTGV